MFAGRLSLRDIFWSLPLLDFVADRRQRPKSSSGNGGVLCRMAGRGRYIRGFGRRHAGSGECGSRKEDSQLVFHRALPN